MELNNPLRSSVGPRPTQAAQNTVNKSVPVTELPEAPAPARNRASGEGRGKPTNPAKPLLAQLENRPDLQQAAELLAAYGMDVSPTKKAYVKHTYEIEEDLHREFHEMHAVLGFKQVKHAMNDALRIWCDKHREEYRRRKGK